MHATWLFDIYLWYLCLIEFDKIQQNSSKFNTNSILGTFGVGYDHFRWSNDVNGGTPNYLVSICI